MLHLHARHLCFLHPLNQNMRFFHEALFIRYSSHCRRIVLCIHKSLLHSVRCSTCILRCIVFCFYCAVGVVFFLAIGRLHFLFTSPLYFLFASPPRPAPCPFTPCCSPISAHFFCCCLCCSPVVPPRPFPLRRASHLKPPNIYYSSSPSPLHCKTYTSRPPFTPPPRHDCEHPFHRIQCSN